MKTLTSATFGFPVSAKGQSARDAASADVASTDVASAGAVPVPAKRACRAALWWQRGKAWGMGLAGAGGVLGSALCPCCVLPQIGALIGALGSMGGVGLLGGLGMWLLARKQRHASAHHAVALFATESEDATLEASSGEASSGEAASSGATVLDDKRQIPVVLVSGFLGAGKTTLMRRLIVDAHARGLKTSVIVNEFGVTDIDSNILKEADADLVGSIAGGCACCEGQEEFLMALWEIGERTENRPDVILVESSGLADPVLMIDSVTVARFIPLLRVGALVCVVDASRFGYISDAALPLLVRQLKLADLIIANKMDKAWDKEDRANRETRNADVIEALRSVNAHARIELAKGCDVDFQELWSRVFDESAGSMSTSGADAGEAPEHRHFQTAVVPMSTPSRREDIEKRLTELSAEVWRVKGFLKFAGDPDLQLLQYAGGAQPGEGDWLITPFPIPPGCKEPQQMLVFIGPRLNRAELIRQFSGQNLLPMFGANS